jgi:hypothetical protein
VLATVFTHSGAYVSPQAFVDGLVPALWVGFGMLVAGAFVTLAFPFSTAAGPAEATAALGADRRESASVVGAA